MDIKQKHINKFIKLANELDLLMKEIRKYCPEANYYTAMETLNLMQGQTHDDTNYQSPLHENVIEGISIEGLDGGDW